MQFQNSAITITFGEQSENHKGMQIIGNGLVDHGFSISELKNIKNNFENINCHTELIILNNFLPNKDKNLSEPAAILIIRDAITKIFCQDMSTKNKTNYDLFLEQISLNWESNCYYVCSEN